MQHVQLGRIEEKARRLVHHEGIVVPAVPQPQHHLHELGGAPVAFVMGDMGGVAEVQRFGRRRRRDQIPSGATVAELVERGEYAGDMKRIKVGRRRGRDQADALRHRRQRTEQGQRLDPVRRGGPLPEADIVGAEGRVGIGGEHEVELCALSDLRQVDEVAQILAGVGGNGGVAPRRDMLPRARQKQAKLHHRMSSTRGCTARRSRPTKPCN